MTKTPMTKVGAFLLTLAASAALAACHGKTEREDDTRSAEGEVLPTTISDAPLPVDVTTSAPPAAPPKDVGDKAAEDASSDADDLRKAMAAMSAQ